MTRDNILYIIYKMDEKTSKEDILKKHVDEKLTNALNYYNTTLEEISKYLMSRDNLKVMRAIATKYKQEEKKKSGNSK